MEGIKTTYTSTLPHIFSALARQVNVNAGRWLIAPCFAAASEKGFPYESLQIRFFENRGNTPLNRIYRISILEIWIWE